MKKVPSTVIWNISLATNRDWFFWMVSNFLVDNILSAYIGNLMNPQILTSVLIHTGTQQNW